MKKEILLHILFWVLYMSIFTFVEGGYSNQFRQAFYMELGFLPFRLFVVYLNYFWLLPRFLLKRKISDYLIYTFLSILLMSFLNRAFFYYYLNAFIFPGWEQGSFPQAYKLVQSIMIITSPMIFLIGLVIMNRWVTSERKAESLENEKVRAELSYLRSQINPHFFFNTLNTLYGLALKKSEKTAEVVMKLSELMSYILYDADRESVTLEKEIDQINRYIDLEQIRYDNRFHTELKVQGIVEDFEIPPLILLPFVENSFKHGVNKSSRDGWLSIAIKVTGEIMSFEIRNKVFHEAKPENDKGGLGIANVKKRLLLLYPESHQLNYALANDQFIVKLIIQKTS